MKRNSGFTLIELVIVIIVLGILAATAVPKFINLQDDARASAMKGVEASIHSAANLVYSRAAINGVETADFGTSKATVDVDGQPVTLANGYPTGDADGIEKSLELSGFTGTTDAAATNGYKFVANGNVAEGSLCISYVQPTGANVQYEVTRGRIASTTTECDTTTNNIGDW